MNSPAIWRAVCVHDRTGCHRSSLYFWGHHIFFYARHPALVIEWVIVFCLFVCSFRNSQEYLRQMLLVFFFCLLCSFVSCKFNVSLWSVTAIDSGHHCHILCVTRAQANARERPFFSCIIWFLLTRHDHILNLTWRPNEILSQSLFSIVACRNKQISAAKTHQIYSNL